MGSKVKKLRKKLGKILGLRPPPVAVARRATAIDIFPDDVLLEIFNFCGDSGGHYREDDRTFWLPFYGVLKWHKLIHVCRRWRQIIFSSPHRLDLYTLCREGSSLQQNIWPAFPVILHYPHCYAERARISSIDEANIIAALQYPDRVCTLKIPVTSSLLGKMSTVAQVLEQFPILTGLWLASEDGSVATLPSGFLGGSAPRLRRIHLSYIPFPTLPTVVSSASDLCSLLLDSIPHTGYFSPEALVTSVAASTRLKYLFIGFQSSTSRPNQCSRGGRGVPPMRSVLPALIRFGFEGASEYLEDLVAHLYAPCVTSINIKYFNQLAFEVPQLFRFISQTQIVKQSHDICASIHFLTSRVGVSFYSGLGGHLPIFLHLEISPCQGLDWQVSHMSEVLSQYSVVLPNVRHLELRSFYLKPNWRDDMDPIEWLALFRLFTPVVSLHVVHRLAGHVADALKVVSAEMAPEILPALHWFESIHEPAVDVEEFNTVRQQSGLPLVTITHTTEWRTPC